LRLFAGRDCRPIGPTGSGGRTGSALTVPACEAGEGRDRHEALRLRNVNARRRRDFPAIRDPVSLALRRRPGNLERAARPDSCRARQSNHHAAARRSRQKADQPAASLSTGKDVHRPSTLRQAVPKSSASGLADWFYQQSSIIPRSPPMKHNLPSPAPGLQGKPRAEIGQKRVQGGWQNNS